MKKVIAGCLLLLAAACPVLAGPTIDVGDVVLLPGTAGQEIQFYATGAVDDLVQGLNFYLQVADGGPEAAAFGLAVDPGIEGPHITAVDLLTGTIFEGNNDGQFGSTNPLPQLWDANVSTVDGTVVANGLIATVTFDTSEWGVESVGQSWDLRLANVAAGVLDLYSGFAGPGPPQWAGEIPTDVVNGSLTIAADDATVTWTIAIPDGETLSRATLDLGVGGTLAFGAGAQLATTGGVSLGGGLEMRPNSPLGGFGEKTQTIIDAAGGVTGTFASEPAAGEHVGSGLFYRVATYGADSVDVELLQAAAGDTNGDGEINNSDLQGILGAGSFGNAGDWDWPQGDFNGDMAVDNSDLQLILATGLFGAGPYVATAGAGSVGVVPEPSTLVMLCGVAVGLLLFWRGRKRAA